MNLVASGTFVEKFNGRSKSHTLSHFKQAGEKIIRDLYNELYKHDLEKATKLANQKVIEFNDAIDKNEKIQSEFNQK